MQVYGLCGQPVQAGRTGSSNWQYSTVTSQVSTHDSFVVCLTGTNMADVYGILLHVSMHIHFARIACKAARFSMNRA